MGVLVVADVWKGVAVASVSLALDGLERSDTECCSSVVEHTGWGVAVPVYR